MGNGGGVCERGYVIEVGWVKYMCMVRHKKRGGVRWSGAEWLWGGDDGDGKNVARVMVLESGVVDGVGW